MDLAIQWATLLSLIIGIAAAFYGICTYRSSIQQKRAEWLYSLHAKFFEGDSYRRVRRMLDYEPQQKIAAAKAALAAPGSSPELEEQFVDYLNFFELVASFEKLNQLRSREVEMVFDYYIKRLGDYPFVMDYMRDNGFESLPPLVKRLRGQRGRA